MDEDGGEETEMLYRDDVEQSAAPTDPRIRRLLPRFWFSHAFRWRPWRTPNLNNSVHLDMAVEESSHSPARVHSIEDVHSAPDPRYLWNGWVLKGFWTIQSLVLLYLLASNLSFHNLTGFRLSILGMIYIGLLVMTIIVTCVEIFRYTNRTLWPMTYLMLQVSKALIWTLEIECFFMPIRQGILLRAGLHRVCISGSRGAPRVSSVARLRYRCAPPATEVPAQPFLSGRSEPGQ